VLKIILLVISILISSQAHAERGIGISGNDFLNICQTEPNTCLLLFVAADSGVTHGHLLIENYRNKVKKGKLFHYFCWEKASNVSYGDRLELFVSVLNNVSDDLRKMPLGSLVANFYREVYPPC